MLEFLQRDIVVRMMKKVNKCVLEQLSEMSVRHIEVEPTVKQYLSEKDLELPVVSGLFLNKAKSSCGSSSVSLMSSNSSVKRFETPLAISVLKLLSSHLLICANGSKLSIIIYN